MLSAFSLFLSFSSAFAQDLTCSFSDSATGDDIDATTATITDFTCIDTVSSSFVTQVIVDATLSGSGCSDWYDFDLQVNGVTIAEDLCSDEYNLEDYVDNLNNITSISAVTSDLDDDSDNVTISLDVDFTYVVTDCPPPNGLAVSSITSSSAMFSWTPNGSEILWDVELVDITAEDTATGTPTTYGVIQDSLALSGLAADNMYEVYVRANCVTGTDVTSVWVGPFAFTTEPTCYPVSDIEVSGIASSGANVSWTSDETTWEIELIDVTASETFTGTPTITSISTDSYDFSGLNSQNEYSFKVRSNCGLLDGNSEWSSSFSFTTLCGVYTPDYIEEFTTYLNSCWSESEGPVSGPDLSDETSSWAGDDFLNNGSASAKINLFSNNRKEWLLTPLFDLSAGGYEINLDAGVTAWNGTGPRDMGSDDTVRIMQSIDGSTWTTVYTWTEANQPTNIGENLSIDISTVTVTGVQFAIFASDGTVDDPEDYDFFIDDFRIRTIPTCFAVSDLTASEIEATTADLNWSVGLDETSWQIELGESGFTQGSGTFTMVADTSVTLSSLLPVTEYEVYVRSVCGIEDSSEWTGPISFTTLPTCFAVSDLSSNTVEATTAVINWVAGLDETSWQIEYGEDGFTQGSGTFTMATDTTTTLSGLLPLTEYEVYVRSVCGIEDSSEWTGPISFTTLPTCFEVSDITASNILITSAVINWTEGLDETSWQVEYGEDGFTQGTGTSMIVSGSTTPLSSLLASTEYDLYVRSVCGVGDSSVWAGPLNFTTLCDANIPDYTEDFATFLDSCWSQSKGSVSGPDYSVTTSLWTDDEFINASSGSQSAKINLFSNNRKEWLISPLFDLSAGGYEINIDAAVTRWNNTTALDMGSDDTVRIMQSINGGISWTTIQTWTEANQPEHTGENFSIEIPSVTSPIARFAIFASDGTVDDSEDYDFFIDNFKVRTIPTCPVFTDLEVSNTLSTTSDLSWIPSGIELSWEIEYGEIGFTQGTGTSINTTNPNYTLTGLDQETAYQAYVRGICGAADSSFWVGPVSFTTLISHDIQVLNFVSPVSQACMLTSDEEVVITISNNGGFDATGFDVSYSFDGVNYTSDGVFAGVLSANSDTAYTLNTTFDFATANDTNLFVAVDLITDTTYITNDTNSYFISNTGNQMMQLHIATNDYASEMAWNIIDTTLNNTVASYSSGGGYDDDSDYYIDFCVFIGNTYSFEAIDSYGDGWNGGLYSISQCGGVEIVNNGGLSPSTSPNNESGQIEAQEYFTVDECDNYDLGIILMDSIYSTCNMASDEQGYLLVQNYGLEDIISSMNVYVEYQINGSGWATLATISDLASGADSLLALPTLDMTTPLTYTFEFQIVYALDENASNNTLDLNIESVDTYSEVEQDFDDAPSGWTAHISTGSALSWEWGVPTTPVIGTDVDGSAWVTRLNENMFLSEESYLLSPCFDFSGYTNDVEYAFDFIWTSTGGANVVRFQVSTDGGSTWPTSTGVDNFTMATNTTEWTEQVGLLDLAGESDVKFRFFMDNSFSTDAEGFGMDNFQVFEHIPYTDTTLIDLTVDGTTVPGFDPAVFNYTYEVPYGTTTVPTVDATVNAPFFESMVVTQAPTITDVATVVVIAEDTNFTATYTVAFTEAPASTDAFLTDITLDGTSLAGFDSLINAYTTTYPYGTTTQPVANAVTSDPNATFAITYSGTLPGSIVIVVTAEDGVTTNTYTVNIDLDPADTISTLSDLTVDGVTVPGFDPSTLEYTVVATGVTALVDYTTTSTLAVGTTSPTGPYAVPSTVVITVTAQNGATTDYTVNLVEPLSDNAYLNDISMDDNGTFVTIPGFDSLVLEYDVELAFGSSVPDVTYTTADADATVDITTSGTTLPGTTTITVTAEDGTITIYVINWTEADANTNNLLNSIVFGTGVEGVILDVTASNVIAFNPNINEYIYYVDQPIYASQITPITYTETVDPTATVTAIVEPTQWGGIYTVTVTAQDGSENVYTWNAINGVGQEELDAGSVSMYPNPSTGLVNVEVVEDITDFTIEVVSTTGQKIFSREYTNDNAQVILDLSTVADGMYYVILKDTQSGKFTNEKISIVK